MLSHLLQAAILGSVQGVTEFLPVSSTAHLIIFERFFGLDPKLYGLSFDMFTNLGTLAASIFYFRSDLKTIFGKLRLPNKSSYTWPELLPWQILGLTAVVGIVGFILETSIESTFRSLWVIVTTLVVVGLLMLVAENKTASSTKKEVGVGSLNAMGLSQMIAFFPGVSRSGITIVTGLFSGLSRSQAARYSFLLSIPITLAATLKRVASFTKDSLETGLTAEVGLFYLIGALVAGVVGYYTIHYLLNYLAKYSLKSFAYYRFIVALALLIYLISS